MANIYIERVEKGDEINELINYKWLTHPEYDRATSRSIIGPIKELAPIILKDLKERKMWFYYLENVWKETGEYDNTVPRMRLNWSWFCLDVLTDLLGANRTFRVLYLVKVSFFISKLAMQMKK